MEKSLHEKMTAEQFDKMASSYSEGLWGIYFRHCYRKIREIAKLYVKPESRILDLGCGTGGLELNLSSLLNENGKIIGVDISPKMIEVANFIIEGDKCYNKYKNIKFILGEADKLPFPDDYFNLVFCLNSLHHHFNQCDTINEISRIMKAGGFFILLDPFLDNPIRKFWGLVLKFLFNEPDAKYHTKKSLEYLFDKGSMKLLKQESFLYFALISIYRKND